MKFEFELKGYVFAEHRLHANKKERSYSLIFYGKDERTKRRTVLHLPIQMNGGKYKGLIRSLEECTKQDSVVPRCGAACKLEIELRKYEPKQK